MVDPKPVVTSSRPTREQRLRHRSRFASGGAITAALFTVPTVTQAAVFETDEPEQITREAQARSQAALDELEQLEQWTQARGDTADAAARLVDETQARLEADKDRPSQKSVAYSLPEPLPRLPTPPFARDARAKFCSSNPAPGVRCDTTQESSAQAPGPENRGSAARSDANYFEASARDEESVVLAGPGEDVVEGSDERDLVWGEEGNDLLYGYGGHDFINAGGGDDLARAGAGDDEIIGGEGNDRIFGGLGRDVIIAGPGDDTIFTGDRYWRDEQWNVVFPGPGRDTVYGAEGPDHVIIPHECEIVPGKVLYGGEGEDVLRLPVSLARAKALGLRAYGFETVIVDDSEPYLSPCSGYTPTPECVDIPEWEDGTDYDTGAVVRVDDQRYRRNFAGTSRPSTFPRNAPDVQDYNVWEPIGLCLAQLRGDCNDKPYRWSDGRFYANQDVVLGDDGNIYTCKSGPYGSRACSYEDPTSPEGRKLWTLERLCLDDRSVTPPPEALAGDEVPEVFDQRLRAWDERYGSDVVQAVYGYYPETSSVFVESGLAYYIGEDQEVERTRYHRRADGSTEIRVHGERLTLGAGEAQSKLHLSLEVAEALAAGYSNLPRSQVRDPDKSWTHETTIYYYNGLDAKFGKYELPWIFNYWSKVLPFKFKKTNSLRSCQEKEQCIHFKEEKGTCSTQVGRNRQDGAHVVNVSPEAYCRGRDHWLKGWQHGACLHEVGHVLGLSHIHQRPDARLRGLSFNKANIKDPANHSQVLPDSYDEASAYGPFDLGSVMMYSRTAFGEGKVTIEGAPKYANRERLTFTDVAGALAANYRKWLYIGKGRDFTKKRRRFQTSAKNMWRWKVDENFGSMSIEDMQSLNVPAGTRVRLFDWKEGHGGTFDSLRYGAYNRIIPVTLKNDVSRIQMRPAVDLFDEAGYNGPHESLDASTFNQFEPVFKTLGSAVVGHGLRATVCGPRHSSGRWKCEELSTGSHWKLDGNFRPERADIEMGATLYREDARNHLGVRAGRAETLVPHRDGKSRRWSAKDLDRSSVMKEARHIYVHPGVSAFACGNQRCIPYEAGIHKIDSAIRPVEEVVVESAVTFFDEDNFDMGSDHQTFVPGEYTAKYGFHDVKDNDLESLIIGPGLEVEICDKQSGKGPCEVFRAPEGKPRFIMSVQDNLINDVSYIKVSR